LDFKGNKMLKKIISSLILFLSIGAPQLQAIDLAQSKSRIKEMGRTEQLANAVIKNRKKIAGRTAAIALAILVLTYSKKT